MIQNAYTILKVATVLVGIIGREKRCERESMMSGIWKSVIRNRIVVHDVHKSVHYIIDKINLP